MLADHPLKTQFDDLAVREATTEELGWVHSRDHIARIAASAERDHTDFDYETAGNRFSFSAAKSAAGAVIGGVDAVVAHPTRPAYALVRPPGHHAERSLPMGFCLFNNAAVAAEYAIRRHAFRRVFIYDWDVHHGNGTMHSFYDRTQVFYASVHQFPHYPGTGTAAEIGAGDGAGYTINLPMPPGGGDPEYRCVMAEIVLPAIRRYKPDIIIVSAGFDAHERDPLSAMNLSTEMYGDMTWMLRQAADEVCEGRLVFALEGGYDLTALADANSSVFHALCGDWESRSPNGFRVDPQVMRLVSRLKELVDL